MNLNPLTLFRRKAADTTRNQGGAIATAMREQQAMGAWSPVFDQWEPRAISPWLYEALKEAIPMLDGALGRMVMLDGIIGVEAESDRMERTIRDWMEGVPVNDLEQGYQAAYASMSEELYEQGHGIVEYTYDDRGRDVIGLRVADSKGTAFLRERDRLRIFYRAPRDPGPRRLDGLDNIENILRGNVRGSVNASMLARAGYVELDPLQLMIALHRPEADNPYGTSLLRSVPFVAQILLRIQNATGRTWERFGDPSFHVNYSTKNRKVDSAEAKRRADAVARDLAIAMEGKARGNSVDIGTGTAADDEITIDVIGAVAETLSIEMPARAMVEQFVAAFGFPAWMMGVSWSQAAGIAEPQSELVLQDARTRFSKRRGALERPVAAMLRARGITWKPGDWQLTQTLPSLHDELKRAQAEFLREQARMVGGGRGADAGERPAAPRGLDNNLRSRRLPRQHKAADPDNEGEPWAEPDPALPPLESGTTAALLGRWHQLRDDTLALLAIDEGSAEPFAFRDGDLAQMLALIGPAQDDMAAALLEAQLAAWDRGVANAADEVPVPSQSDLAEVANRPASEFRLNSVPLAVRKRARKMLLDAVATGHKAGWFDNPIVAAAIAVLRSQMRRWFGEWGLSLVRGGLEREMRVQVATALASGEFDGQNPVNVARELRRRFDAGDYNWERLARSEIAMSQSHGKREMYRQQGVTTVDYMTAGDEKVSAICRRLEAAGPYELDSAPIPVEDSHPNCRCTLLAAS